MLPQNPLPQLILPRIQSAVNRLSEQIWTHPIPLVVEATAFGPGQHSLEQAKRLPRTVQKAQSCWGKLFDQRWCRIVLQEATGDNAWLHWQEQGEATLYVDDQAYWGFNVAHDRCRLPAGVKELWLQSSCVQSAI